MANDSAFNDQAQFEKARAELEKLTDTFRNCMHDCGSEETRKVLRQVSCCLDDVLADMSLEWDRLFKELG
jgi:hypothetical protein